MPRIKISRRYTAIIEYKALPTIHVHGITENETLLLDCIEVKYTLDILLNVFI